MTERATPIWDDLRAKRRFIPVYLEAVSVDGLRGFADLRVSIDYPVSVIAGGNGSGKTTLLLAAACAFSPGDGSRRFSPSVLFPSYRPRNGEFSDDDREVNLSFEYAIDGLRATRAWRKQGGPARRFRRRGGEPLPEHDIYLRTLRNLADPSEARIVARMTRSARSHERVPFDATQIAWAERMLPFRYSSVVDLTSAATHLLVAAQNDGAAYSELHMAAGERSILRLAQEIAHRRRALVLIDEVEAGLHPFIQQVLMLQLQQLALTNDVQVIVTTHSPVILDAVPPEARIILDRDESGRVLQHPPYHDIVQDALYGRASESLNILCEDVVAESIINGIFDVLQPRLGLRPGSYRVGRDTGAGEFPGHARAFRKFGQIRNFAFILDGDQRSDETTALIRRAADADVPVAFLPGNGAPEEWVWSVLQNRVPDAAVAFGVDAANLAAQIQRRNALYDAASDTQARIAKAKLESLAEGLARPASDICRIIARIEAERTGSEIAPVVAELERSVRERRGSVRR